MAISTTTFPNGRDIDECVAHDVDVDLVRSGDTRYDIVMTHATQGALALRVSTRTGEIAVDVDHVLGIDLRLEHDGSLASLSVRRCALHLEHLSRGQYALSLTSDDGANALLRFVTRGRLKCKAVEPE